jgi:hypothetical protein
VRIAQVANLVELPHAEKDSRQMVLPKSEILRREVYVKELKGETMVRKLLMWKTNKEQVADDFPAYVVHLTDFSPNRKDPLSREMRISSSFEQIQQLFDGLKTENITKGWNLFAKTESGPKEVPAPLVVAAQIDQPAVNQLINDILSIEYDAELRMAFLKIGDLRPDTGALSLPDGFGPDEVHEALLATGRLRTDGESYRLVEFTRAEHLSEILSEMLAQFDAPGVPREELLDVQAAVEDYQSGIGSSCEIPLMALA